MPGLTGAPDLTAGQGIPGPGGGGGGGGSSAPPLPADLPVLLWSADSRATAGVVFGGPFVVTSTGIPPTDVRYLWLDTQSGTGIPKYYDTTSTTWLTLVGTGGTSVYRWGSGAPASGLGANGDLYIDTATGDMYAKATGAWSLVVNLIGPAGASLSPTGIWNIGTSYNPLDTVSSGGSSYVAISANSGTDPATHPLVWQLLAAGGNGQLLCSAADTTPDYLSAKLAVSGYWTWTIVNPGSNETLQIGFASQAANTVLRSGNSGGVPAFGALTNADLPAGTPNVKRRVAFMFQCPSTSFSGSIDDAQIWIMPLGEGNTSLTWVPSRLTLYCSGVSSPPHSATVQIFSNTEPSLSGSPAALTGTLTLTATSSHASWSIYTVTFSGSPSISSGEWIMAQWSNDLSILNCWCEIEFEATVNTA